MDEDYALDEPEEKTITNEFGEEISLAEIQDIARRIRKFEKKQIDDIFFGCGYRERSRGKNRSLSDKRLEEIKENPQAAFEVIKIIFQETRRDDFFYSFNEKLNLEPHEDIDEFGDEDA
jgi:hypothetical protein